MSKIYFNRDEITRQPKCVGISGYIISFGKPTAPNTIDIFYGMECGFSREFLRIDFMDILTFAHTEKAWVRLYPAALDPSTAIFAEHIRYLALDDQRQLFLQYIRGTLELKMLLPQTPSENVFFDITKILADHPDITETLMIKINGTLLEEVPSLFAVETLIK